MKSSRFYSKNLTHVAIALVCFVACSKERTDPASILMSKTWFPYQVEIQTIDSTSVTVTDKVSGEQKETNQVFKTDTIYLASGCQQQSLYHFKANRVQTITDSCSPNSTDYTDTWKIDQMNNMLLSQFVTGDVPFAGLLTAITPSEFIINRVPDYMLAFADSTDTNGNHVFTGNYNFIKTIMTFKSR
jgi:hypothetical protein